MKLRPRSFLVLSTACLLWSGCGDRDGSPKPNPEPAAAPAAVARDSGTADENERQPSGYACTRPERAKRAPPARIERRGRAFVFDPDECKAPASGHEWLSLGSISVAVKGRRGDVCEYEITSEVEGGYSVVGCAAPAGGPVVEIPFRGAHPPHGCKQLKSGNLLLEQREFRGFFSHSIPGAHYMVSELLDTAEAAASKEPPGEPIARYGLVEIRYQLFDDEQFTKPTTGDGASGTLAFRHGLGEVGSAIEAAIDLTTRVGSEKHVTFREEVAHGLRDLLPPHSPGAKICAKLTVTRAEPGALPESAPRCPDGTVWHCHVGPTSVSMDSDDRLCGCRVPNCRKLKQFLWTTPGEGTWPDGTRKAVFECVDDQERIRRTRDVFPR